MALDSTGYGCSKKVPCFACEKTKLEYYSRRPEYGHDGAPLNLGSSMGAHGSPILNMANAKFFTLIRGTDAVKTIIATKRATINWSANPYHYGGYHEPSFGTRVRETVFVCAHCVEYYGEGLEGRVGEIADSRLNQEYAVLLHTFFVGPSWRSLSKFHRWHLHKRLNHFIEDLECLAPGKNINPALQTFRKIRTELTPPRKKLTKKSA